ncbi:hypothetical protein, partial [Microcoleus sp. OTE_8_concoct_300]|uniref:hypothetical protein n=1 Tax=Microcoleus sp. OTE_8_concoct_300 TaxID=2964710 RepID=UPI00403FBA04
GAWGMGHGAWGMGHGAWGMGHGAWGMGHGAWGMGHGAWGIPHFLKNRYIGEGRSPIAAGRKARSSAINHVLVVLAVAIK